MLTKTENKNNCIMTRFYELARSARLTTNMQCMSRATELADLIINQCQEPDTVSILAVKHKNGNWFKPRNIDIKWYYHFCVQWNKQILDPSYGKILSFDNYLSSAFFDHENLEMKDVFVYKNINNKIVREKVC